MRLAFFSDNFYPELSGISDVIITLVQALAQRGHQIRCIVPNYSPDDYKQINRPVQELKLGKGITIERIPSVSYSRGGAIIRAVVPTGLRWLKLQRWKPDLIHSHHFFGVGLEALIAAKILQRPLLGTQHTAITEYIHYSPIRADWVKKMSLQYAVWYYNTCDFVTAPAQVVFDEMESHGLTQPHRVISNIIDQTIFHPSTMPPDQPPTLVYAGRFSIEKRLPIIIHALARVKKDIPNIHLLLAGNGPVFSELERLVKKLQLSSAVRFLGTLNQSALAKVYQSAHLFVITSTAENQSMAVLQAMACGLPIVAVRARGLPEYINQHNGCLVPPNNPDQLAQAIVKILTQPIVRQQLGSAAQKQAHYYTKEYTIPLWETLYTDLIKRAESFR